jgi:hypothetical protein
MEEHNINEIFDFAAGELSGTKEEKFKKHLAECSSCSKEIEEITGALKLLDASVDELPSDSVFNNIIADISSTLPQENKVPEKSIAVKIFEFVLVALCFTAVVFLVNNLLGHVFDWEELKTFWFFGFIGRIGVSIGIVFAVATFFTLALLPVIFFEQLKGKNI